MKIKTDPAEIYQEYQDGVAYNTQLGLYDNVKRNNNFYNDLQWEGVKAPDLDKPVFNFLKPVVNYYIAMLISDDIAANVELGDPAIENAISTEIGYIMERENMAFKNRRGIRNAAVDGDVCFYNWFDPEAESGQMVKGQICTDLVDNTNVIFGDPTENDPQKQPFIIIARRLLTDFVKEEAEEEGQDPSKITPDSESLYLNSDKTLNVGYTTVLLKMWPQKKELPVTDKETGLPVLDEDGEQIIRTVKSIHMMKVTQQGTVKPEWDTDYRRYPVSWMNWEIVKNCYHGIAPLTGKIQNQIFVNKAYAMAFMFVARMAFPKIIYNKDLIKGGWDNRIGSAIAVSGDPNIALFANFQSGEMSASVPNLINSTVTQTKDLMGANDTALGNVQPDNTSAIITTQNQSRIQLDMQRLDFYNCAEGYIKSWIDMMRVHYGVRTINTMDANKQKIPVQFDFSTLEEIETKLKIDVGQGSYWSEIVQLQTLDSMFRNGIIPNAVAFLERLPDGMIKDKQGLIDAIKATEQPVAQAAGIPGTQPTEQPQPGGDPETDQMRRMLDELSGMRWDQIAGALDSMNLPEQDKARIIELLKARGV
jgi:hypothetical protein